MYELNAAAFNSIAGLYFTAFSFIKQRKKRAP